MAKGNSRRLESGCKRVDRIISCLNDWAAQQGHAARAAWGPAAVGEVTVEKLESGLLDYNNEYFELTLVVVNEDYYQLALRLNFRSPKHFDASKVAEVGLVHPGITLYLDEKDGRLLPVCVATSFYFDDDDRDDRTSRTLFKALTMLEINRDSVSACIDGSGEGQEGGAL